MWLFGGAAFLLVFSFGIRPSEIFDEISEKMEDAKEHRKEEIGRAHV